jgi:hypothetical protein
MNSYPKGEADQVGFRAPRSPRFNKRAWRCEGLADVKRLGAAATAACIGRDGTKSRKVNAI